MTPRETAAVLYADGRKQTSIARELGVSQTTVSKWLRYWRPPYRTPVSAFWFDVGAA